MVKLETGSTGPEIYLKLENLQPINSFKLRGAANAIAIKAPYDAWWEALERRAYSGVEGTFIHPFDSDDFIAGNATIGLEIIEDLPQVATVIAPIGGGGLVTGVASGVRARKPAIAVFGAEPETAAPVAHAFATGKASVFPHWQASFVDGAGGKSLFPAMWQRLRPVVDGSIVVSLDETKRAMRLLAERSRVVAEGAGALAVAAALSGKAGTGPIVAIVSGGNIELSTFCELIG